MRIDVKDLEGRKHYVVPMVMITEGVHNGSNGPVYYPANVLKRTSRLWNGKPIVVYHPTMYSDSYADNPEVFNRQKIGTVFNTQFDGQRLKAEAWIDAERAEKVDGRVVRAIRSRQMMEVSTGLAITFNPQEGTFNGRTYAARADDMHPDHLAVLPDQTGACSIADGAGLIRNQWLEEYLPLPAITY